MDSSYQYADAFRRIPSLPGCLPSGTCAVEVLPEAPTCHRQQIGTWTERAFVIFVSPSAMSAEVRHVAYCDNTIMPPETVLTIRPRFIGRHSILDRRVAGAGNRTRRRASDRPIARIEGRSPRRLTQIAAGPSSNTGRSSVMSCHSHLLATKM